MATMTKKRKTTKAKKVTKLAKLEEAKKSIKKLNNNLIDSSFEVLKKTVKTGEKWEKLAKKMLKKSEPLRKQQLAMFNETTESIKEQIENGTIRLKNLVGYEEIMETIRKNPLAIQAEKITSKLKKEAFEKIEDVKDTFEETKDKLEVVAEDVKEKFEKVTENVMDKFEDVVEDVKEKISGKEKKTTKVAKKSKATKTKAKTTKKLPKKKPVTKKVVKKVSTAIVSNDLKVLHGIGPKIETVLNENGVHSYDNLAKMTIKNLNIILEKAGVNTKMYNTSEWKSQAKLAAKGNMEGLTAFIKEIKSKK